MVLISAYINDDIRNKYFCVTQIIDDPPNYFYFLKCQTMSILGGEFDNGLAKVIDSYIAFEM